MVADWSGVFHNKTGFQFILQIAIRRKSKTLGSFAHCVQLDQFLGYVLNLSLCFTLKVLPRFTAYLTQSRRSTVFAYVMFWFLAGNVYPHTKNIVVLVHQTNWLLHMAIDGYFFQSRKSANAMVYEPQNLRAPALTILRLIAWSRWILVWVCTGEIFPNIWWSVTGKV